MVPRRRDLIRRTSGSPGELLPAERNPRELDARIVLALVRRDYRHNPARYKHPPSGVLAFAIQLRELAPACCYYDLLTSLAKHLARGLTSHDWAYLYITAVAQPLRARSKQRLD